jgi:hypothetical protein
MRTDAKLPVRCFTCRGATGRIDETEREAPAQGEARAVKGRVRNSQPHSRRLWLIFYYRLKPPPP